MGVWHPVSGNGPSGPEMRFSPIDIGGWVAWGGAALLLVVAPMVFHNGFAITLLSQMGVMIVFCLSYNMLLGQGGMLSFGHAVYSGLGAYFAVHALNMIGSGALWLPVSLIPLVGGVFGALFGVLFGYVTTKKSGTPFAMITLGIGELVFACVLMFPGFFGGEGGVTTNRTVGKAFFGYTLGPDIQVYYLIAAWCFVCMVAMYAFTQTPLGRMSNAVRENPERVEFIGYNTQRVRYLVLIVSAFFAGISGGLSTINFEIVSAENVSALQSGGVLLATFIGGSLFFFGPILGAIIFTFFAVALSDYTKAWQLYLGAFFVLMVMFAPGGVASILLVNLRVMKHGLFGRLRGPLAGVLLAGAVMLLGLIMIIEMAYHMTLDAANGTTMMLFGFQVDAGRSQIWVLALGVLAGGAAAFEATRRQYVRAWDAVQESIEDRIAREGRA